MKTSNEGLKLIEKFEGVRLSAYKAVPSEELYTIGFGHYGVQAGTVITLAQAEELLKQDVVTAEKAINKYVSFELNQPMFDALVSFTFNCGAGNLKKLVSGRKAREVSDNIVNYNKSGGVVINGLTRRRSEEQAMFVRGMNSMSKKNEVQKILDVAVSQIGVKESPANSNNVKYNTKYYGKSVSGSAYPWCSVYVWWVFNETGLSNLFCNGKKVAYCPTVETWAKDSGIWHSTGQAGDLCLMDFGKGRASHIGIVEKVNVDGSYTTIEGNTSNAGSQDNGGAVCRKIRYKKNIRGFARPRYNNTSAVSATTTTTTTTQKTNSSKYTKADFARDLSVALGAKNGVEFAQKIKKTIISKNKNNTHPAVKCIQKYLGALGYNVGTIDGEAGNMFDMAVKRYQSDHGLLSDGECGPTTLTYLIQH